MKTLLRRCAASTFTVALLATVLPAGAAHAATTVVMTYNTYYDAHTGLEDAADVIRDSGASIVALQETRNDTTKDLADELGWSGYTQSGYDTNIISSDKITKTSYFTTDSNAHVAGAYIGDTWVYSVHLSYLKYGPYDACFNDATDAQLEKDEELRTEQAEEVVNEVDDSGATLIMGDFNTPSHLDWTNATEDSHCGTSFAWPATKELDDAGYTDAYREVNPNPATKPGNTWSP